MAIIWLVLLFNLTAFPLTNGLLPYVAREIYHVDQTGLGYLIASIAFGAMLGGVLMSRARHRRAAAAAADRVGRRLARPAAVLRADADALPAASSRCWLPASFQSLAMVSLTVILVRESGQRFRGRVMGVRMLAIYSLPVGLLIAGALIERIGFAATATLYAAVGLVFTIIIALRWREHLWPAAQPAPAE